MVLPDPGEVTGHDGQAGALLVSAPCRGLRRELRPLVWMVLEDVALDAVVEEGRLVARTSARRLAEQLRIDPGTAASALRQLRQRGLLALERGPRPAGRFGLAVYVLRDVEGLAVVAPCGMPPHMVEPVMVRPCGAERDASREADSPVTTAAANPSVQPGTRRGVAGVERGRNGRHAQVAPLAQGALDLGLGTA